MKSFVEAENIKLRHPSSSYLCALHGHKASIFAHNFNYPKAIRELNISGEYASSGGFHQAYYASVINNALMFLFDDQIEKADSCIALIDKDKLDAFPVLKKDWLNLGIQRIIYANQSKPYVVGKIDSLVAHEDSACLPWGAVSKAYVRHGAPLKAMAALNRYKQDIDTLHSVRYYVFLSEILDSLNYSAQSLEAYKRYVAISDSVDLTIFNQETNYLEERYLNKEKSDTLQFFVIGLLFLLAGATVAFLSYKKRIARQNVVLEGMYRDLQKEYEGLKAIRDFLDAKDAGTKQLLEERLRTLKGFFSKDRPKSLNLISSQLENLSRNRKDLLDTVGLLFAVYHPSFVEKLIAYHLTTTEIGYSCLLVLGFRVGEMGDVINRSDYYNISSLIRKKIGLTVNDTNLNIWMKKEFESSANGD